MNGPELLEIPWVEKAVISLPPAPPEVEQLLWKAARSYSDTEGALFYLNEADRLYGDSMSVVLGCYKFHFYKGHLRQAIPFAWKAARIMGARLGLPVSFDDVRPEDAAFSEFESGPRFYLFAMKAVGYLHARLGETETALEILYKIRELDSCDRMGISCLIAVIENGGKEDEE